MITTTVPRFFAEIVLGGAVRPETQRPEPVRISLGELLARFRWTAADLDHASAYGFLRAAGRLARPGGIPGEPFWLADDVERWRAAIRALAKL